MPVSVVIPEELIRYSDGHKQIEIEASTIDGLLTELFTKFPDLKLRLIDERGHFYPYIPAFLNDQKLPLSGTCRHRLKDGDQLAFVVIASGG